MDKPTVSLSMTVKVNLGNYESADAFLALSNLTKETTQAEIQDLLDTGQIAYKMMRNHMNLKVEALRKERKRTA